MRGEGIDSREDQADVNVAKTLGAPYGTHDAERRRSPGWEERRGLEDSHRLVVRTKLAQGCKVFPNQALKAIETGKNTNMTSQLPVISQIRVQIRYTAA
jgi:hypothetical protein